MKFLSTFIRALGVMVIISIAGFSIFMNSVSKDFFSNPHLNSFFKYIYSFEDRFYDYRIRHHLDLENICNMKQFERLVSKEKVTSEKMFNDKFGKGSLKKYIYSCDDVQTQNLINLSFFKDEKYFSFKEEIRLIVKDIPIDKKIKRVSSLKESKKNKLNKYVSDKIVLVEVDDESLAKINSWPIPRDNWVTLIRNLKKYDAKVVAFDVLFPEEVKSCGAISPDDHFASAIKEFQADGRKSVIIPFTVQNAHAVNVEFFDEAPYNLYTSMVTNVYENDDVGLNLSKVEKHTWPIEKLLDSEPQLGYLNMEEDPDGVFRHYQLLADVGGLVIPSLGYRSYASYIDTSPKLIVNTHSSYLEMEDDIRLEVNLKGETKLKWVGWKGSYESISLHKVLFADPNDDYLYEFFKDKIVFIGSTATGAHDLRNTAIDSKLPGIYAHMNFTDMLLQKNFFENRESSIKYSYIFLISSMLVLIITMFFGSAILDLIMTLAILGATYYLDYMYFINDGYEVKLFFIYFSVIATYSYITFLNFNKASAEKKQIKGAFSRYVAPSIVDEMLDNPDKLKVGGEKRDITCMFSDVRDFTSISEQLTPTELALALNRYMGEMTDIVFETKGTLDKYIGDAIVAFWGAPVDIEDHVNSAMDASVKMMEALPKINEEFKAKGLPEFKIGLGLNSGECSVGNMGSDQIFAYTALGDNMNLGARLESLCKHYGAQILVSEYTYERMDQNIYKSRLIDKVKVKGKTEPVGVYEVLYSYHAFMIDQESLANFKKAFQLFLEGKFKEAKEIFAKLHELHPSDKASKRMLDTCIGWIEKPPLPDQDWTITTMTTKG